MPFLRRAWRVLTWSPLRGRISHMPWYAHAFRILWTVPLVMILLGWCDDTVVFDGPVTEGDGADVVEREPNWNADLYVGDGRCLVIATREMVDC